MSPYQATVRGYEFTEVVFWRVDDSVPIVAEFTPTIPRGSSLRGVLKAAHKQRAFQISSSSSQLFPTTLRIDIASCRQKEIQKTFPAWQNRWSRRQWRAFPQHDVYDDVDTSGEDVEVEKELELCVECGVTPCYWKQFGADVVHLTAEKLFCAEKSSAHIGNDVHDNEDNVHSNEKLKVALRTYMKERYSFLIAANSVCLLIMSWKRCLTSGRTWSDRTGVLERSNCDTILEHLWFHTNEL